MVMGDVVLTEDQVNAALSAALDNGLQVTALHNHFFWDSPKVMFMHIGGMGDEAKMATAVGKVFAVLKEKEKLPARTSILQEHAGPGPARRRLRQEGRVQGRRVQNHLGPHHPRALAGR